MTLRSCSAPISSSACSTNRSTASSPSGSGAANQPRQKAIACPIARGNVASGRVDKLSAGYHMILLANSPAGGAGAAGPETFLFCTWFGRQSRPNQVQNQMLLGGQSPPNLPSE